MKHTSVALSMGMGIALSGYFLGHELLQIIDRIGFVCLTCTAYYINERWVWK